MRPWLLMILVAHLLVGTALAVRSRYIILSFLLGFLSHFFLDFLPHWDYLTKITLSFSDLAETILDLILGIVLILIFTRSYLKNKKFLILIIAGLAGALLPDFLNFLYLNFNLGWLEYFFQIHHKIHYWQDLSFWQGMPATLIVSLLAILSLLLFKM